MPEAVSVAVAKGVTSFINAAVSARTLSQQFTPVRSYADWDLDLKTLDALECRDEDKLHVDVVAHTIEQEVELATRGSVRFKVPVDIAVREKLGPDKQDDDTGRLDLVRIDELMLLTQELYVMFMPTRLAAFDAAAWDSEGGTKIMVAPVKAHLRSLRQFTSIIRVHFIVHLQTSA